MQHQKRPSETAAGRKWLEQFVSKDAQAATLLLDSLRIPASPEVSNGLAARLETLIEDKRDGGRVLLLPERSEKELTKVVRKVSGETPLKSREYGVFYKDTHPGSPINVQPGSEGAAASVIKRLVRTRGDVVQGPEASLKTLLDQNIGTIIVVTDNSASGGQMLKFGKALVANTELFEDQGNRAPAIGALTFTATKDAEKILRSRESPYDWLEQLERTPSIETSLWSVHDKEAVVDVCKRYVSNKEYALGYGGAGALFAWEHSVPNSLPGILWMDGQRWEPLFPRKVIPSSFLREIGSYVPNQSSVPETGHETARFPRAQSSRLQAVLHLLSQGITNELEVAEKLGWDRNTVEGLRASCVTMGLADEDGLVTRAGANFLLAARGKRREIRKDRAGRKKPYYPWDLRPAEEAPLSVSPPRGM